MYGRRVNHDRRSLSGGIIILILTLLMTWSICSVVLLWSSGNGKPILSARLTSAFTSTLSQPGKNEQSDGMKHFVRDELHQNQSDGNMKTLGSDSIVSTQPTADTTASSSITSISSSSSATGSTTASEISYAKGIILCLHEEIVPMGISLIRELRCLGNTELVQVFYCFPDEISNHTHELFRHLDDRVQLIDVCTEMLQSGKMDKKLAKTFRSYWIKPLALYHTNITEVLLLDADVLAMRDPSIIRSSSGYQKTGTMFFYDRVVKKRVNFNRKVKLSRTSKDPPVQYLKAWVKKFPYARFNLSGPNPSGHLKQSLSFNESTCHEQDSSMLAVDKSRSGKALDVLWYMMTEKRFLYKFSWGDKEAFWLSWEFAHQPYTFSPWGVSAIDSFPNGDVKRHPETLCGNMAHYMPIEEDDDELLYVNGKTLLDPYPFGLRKALKTDRLTLVYNLSPTYVSLRHPRKPVKPFQESGSTIKNQECLTDLGSKALSPKFHQRLLRRRMHLIALWGSFLEPLENCEESYLKTVEE
uniref:Uncharacterized protein AlNc14C9G1158 n=1 Tax=Albugo laibachii Nc14 TaxID=890382 RepID=F0W2A8_9STRA|nr:conserved hypothetical protein [Albugo laibachii Nc14]|eukprot:CCA15193.1 conserved hypothetical protein [Albugo laibachii Nc14]